MITVPVRLGERSYDVLVGRGARHRLLEVLPLGAARAAVVTQEGINIGVDTGIDQRTFVMGAGERGKDLETVEDLCRQLSRWGLTRGDVVVAVGGGVVTDTTGFTAAVYHRGVRWVAVPTTLLGQVDAAIGGKTGVNLPEGKNLVGAFWQPSAVLCDTEVLETLPPREYRSGLGEVAKYHFLSQGEVLADLPLDEKVAKCVALKAAYVAADERDATGASPGGSRSRAILNYGHTLGHALETAGHYDLRHGEAVAIGLVFAALLAERLGRIDHERVEEHRRIVAGYDLPLTLPPDADTAQLLDLMGRDKKAVNGMAFVLDGPCGLEVVTGVAAADVEAALKEIAT
ncbi:MAG: 3-dehydroquinate synthase [Acidimicrobiia bacterium]|nr:3-dehydroquinate synthase [Acidimicrobiia bacterium]